MAVIVNERWDEWLDEMGNALTLFARQFVPSHADAEEAVHDGFIRFWKTRNSANHPKALLFSCVKRAAQDVNRRESRRRRRESEFARQSEPEASFVCPVEHRDRQIAVERALNSLPNKQREVLVMKIWGQATFAQVAEAFGISPNTAASRYRYAMEALRKLLGEHK